MYTHLRLNEQTFYISIFIFIFIYSYHFFSCFSRTNSTASVQILFLVTMEKRKTDNSSNHLNARQPFSDAFN